MPYASVVVSVLSVMQRKAEEDEQGKETTSIALYGAEGVKRRTKKGAKKVLRREYKRDVKTEIKGDRDEVDDES